MRSFFNRKKAGDSKTEDMGAITKNLSENLEKAKGIFEYPANIDFSIREVYIKALKAKGVILYMSGAVDQARIEQNVITPLLGELIEGMDGDKLTVVMNKIIRAAQVKTISSFSDLTRDIVSGYTILLIDGYAEAVSISTTSFEARGVEKTQIENVIKGPKEAFVESAETNRSLVRKYVQNEKLITESITIGERSLYEVSIMYIKDIADPELVESVKKRVSEI